MNVRSLATLSCALTLAVTFAAAATPLEELRAAQELLRTNQPGRALTQFSDLRTRYPTDADYALGRAQALRQLGRTDEALDELAAASALAPDYEDVWRTRYALLESESSEKAYVAREHIRAHAANYFPNSTWWHVVDTPPAWDVLVGAGYDALSNGLPSWNNQFFELSRARDGVDRTAFGVSRNQRYRRADYSLSFGYERQLAKKRFAGARMSFGLDPEFQPENGLEAYVGTPFGAGWVGTLAYRWKNFQAADVSSYVATVEKYHRSFRFFYTLTWSHLHGATSFANHGLGASWYYRDNDSIGLSFSAGEEAEILETADVLRTSVNAATLTGRHRISEKLTLQWWLGNHSQGRFYRRQFLGMAVSIGL